jgi:hypothetical protein
LSQQRAEWFDGVSRACGRNEGAPFAKPASAGERRANQIMRKNADSSNLESDDRRAMDRIPIADSVPFM